jgi:hypothetical protein
MEEKVLKLAALPSVYPRIYMCNTGDIVFQIDKDVSLNVSKEGKATIRGLDGESEATPAIYHALRKFLHVSEE